MPRSWALSASLLSVLLVLGAQAFLLSKWTAVESRPPAWDQAIHLEIAHDYKTLLAKGDWYSAFNLKPKPGMPPFPPLYQLSLIPAYNFADPVRASLWVQYGYLVLLCLALWGLGVLYCGPWEAFAAVLLFSSTPVVQSLTRTQLPDMPLATWVALGYLAYAASAGFMRWIPSLAFGLVFAGGMLTKWSYWTYFFPLIFVAVGAWRSPIRRAKFAGAAALALAITLPWYLSHLPVLLPRLKEASTDQGVPVWRISSMLEYLWAMLSGFDLPFWLACLPALIVPRLKQAREDRWVIPIWVLTSYLFWMLVPNHQLRFLLPGLSGLALLVAGRWPASVLALLCGYQAFALANYSYRWATPVRFDFFGPALTLFSSDAPVSQDWKIEEILKEASRRHDASEPFGNVTLVANDVFFNGPNFNWVLKHAGLSNLRMRGVNRRYCEFSEFVVIKTGSLGPPPVIGQLEEVRWQMLAHGGWFRRGYEEVAKWTLPDGGEALLFERRKAQKPPMAEKDLSYASFESGEFSAKDLRLSLGRWDPAQRVYPRAVLKASWISLRGLELDNVELVLEGLDLVPVLGIKGELEDVRLLKLKRLGLASASLDAPKAAAFLGRRARQLKDISADLGDPIAVRGRFKGLPVAAEGRIFLSSDHAVMEAKLLRAKIGPLGLPIPERWGKTSVSFEPNPETPFEIRVPGFSAKGSALTIP